MDELARFDSRFGLVRVLQRKSDGARLYCIESSIQTMATPDGVSLFGYVHAAKLLMRSAHKVLILGGGGGSLATMLARAGHDVTVLDIDPVAEILARTYFALDGRVRWITGELGSACEIQGEKFDAVCVDACDATGLVSEFSEPDALIALIKSFCPDGALVLNLVHQDGAPAWGAALAAQLSARGLSAVLYRAEDGWEGNEILHLRTHGGEDILRITNLQQRPAEVRSYLMSLRARALAL